MCAPLISSIVMPFTSASTIAYSITLCSAIHVPSAITPTRRAAEASGRPSCLRATATMPMRTSSTAGANTNTAHLR